MALYAYPLRGVETGDGGLGEAWVGWWTIGSARAVADHQAEGVRG